MPTDRDSHVLRDIISDGIDIVTFTSSSTVSNLAQLLDGDLGPLSDATIGCIGPVTAATAREMGLKVDIIAKEYTVQGLVEAMKAYFIEEVTSNG